MSSGQRIKAGWIVGGGVNASHVIYSWTSTSTRQSIPANTRTALSATNFRVIRQSSDNILLNCFSGTTFTAPADGFYTVTWCGRMATSSAGGLGGYINEFWINYGPSVQVSHQSGYGMISATNSWTGFMNASDTLQFIGFCAAANSFAASGFDHTLSISLNAPSQLIST